MLFKEIIAVYCEGHTKFLNTLCGQNAEFMTVKASRWSPLGFKGLKKADRTQPLSHDKCFMQYDFLSVLRSADPDSSSFRLQQ
jgi:hypothetical protein